MALLIETDGTTSNVEPEGLTFALNELQASNLATQLEQRPDVEYCENLYPI